MPLIRIEDFGSSALNVDVQPTLLKPGEWSAMTNIDVESGDIRSAWGESIVEASPPCEPLYQYRFEGLTSSWLIISDGVGVFASDGKSWQDITPVALAGIGTTWQDFHDEATTWSALEASNVTWGQLEESETDPVPFAGRVSFSTFLGILVVTPDQGAPSYWPSEDGRMAPLPGWDINNWTASQVIGYANFLVALEFDDGTIIGPQFRVAWSDAAAEGEIPQSWDFADVTALAGSVQLRDTEGKLTVAELLRNDLIIYKADSIYRMFLRNDTSVMGFERVISDHGCDSWRGVARMGAVHFFADAGDIRIYDGQNTQSITTRRIKERLAVAIDNESRDMTAVVPHPDREQVWVGVVPAGSDTFDNVLIFSLEHNSWTPKKYPGLVSMCMGHLSVSGGSGRTWQDLHDEGITWAMWDETWGSSFYNPSERGITMATATTIFQTDKSNTDFEGNAKYCVAERQGFLLADMPQRVTVRRIFPEMQGDAVVQIQVGAVWYPGETVRWTAPQDFRVGVDRKLNVRVTGQPTALRIVSQQDASWRLGAVSLAFSEAGRR